MQIVSLASAFVRRQFFGSKVIDLNQLHDLLILCQQKLRLCRCKHSCSAGAANSGGLVQFPQQYFAAQRVLQFTVQAVIRFQRFESSLQQRQDAIKRLGIRTSHLIDITPEHLSMALVNRYLDIKESWQL